MLTLCFINYYNNKLSYNELNIIVNTFDVDSTENRKELISMGDEMKKLTTHIGSTDELNKCTQVHI